MVLDRGVLLEAWTKVRIVCIPKSAGGFRVLGIAAIAWRAGMTCLVRKLHPWVEQWIHEDLLGGIQGRGGDMLHDVIMADLSTAWEDSGGCLGALGCRQEDH